MCQGGKVAKCYRVHVITVSDRCSRGESEDTSGPALKNAIKEAFPDWLVTLGAVIPDEEDEIAAELTRIGDGGAVADRDGEVAAAEGGEEVGSHVHLVVTTGGTGFTPRDVTPEATKRVIQKECPGLVIAMMQSSLAITPYAMLSRAASGIYKRTLIVNVPGSRKGSVENFQAIVTALPHALRQINESAPATAADHQPPAQ